MDNKRRNSVSSARPSRYNKKFRLIAEETVGENSSMEILYNPDSGFLDDQQGTGAVKPATNNGDCNTGADLTDDFLTKESTNTQGQHPEASDKNYTLLINDLLEQIRCGDLTNVDEENISDEEAASDTDDEDICDDHDNVEQPTSDSYDIPIYAGHHMTMKTSMILILLYAMKYAISGSQLSDLLTLIGLHCIKSHRGLQSLFHFKKFFADLQSPFIKHFYCTFCFSYVSANDKTCQNKKCMRDISSSSKSLSYFIEIPINSQIKTLFQRDGFDLLIKHRFTRNKQQPCNIEDIYDGEVYKTMSEGNGPLSEQYPYNISLTINTDGIPIFKSSKFSIWPIYLMVNELPFRERKLTENLILAGIWFGDSKPCMATFSIPLQRSLQELESLGIEVNFGNERVISKAFLICSSADLPARSLLLNMTQYNGAYSCQRCLQRGNTFKTTKGGSIHTYPYEPYTERTDSGCRQHAITAAHTQRVQNGIKGPSFLMCLKSYNFIKGTTIDYMHGILLGISKLMMQLWFNSANSREQFSISTYTEVVDKRLLNLKPPSFITRTPRTISSHMKYWKASEIRAWLFYYSLPLLSDILQECYFIHYAAFVEAAHLLCGDSITPESISRSELLLSYFVMVFKDLYGERYLTLNMHLLLHLSKCVQEMGPLWAYSCFPFEDANGKLTRQIHGTQNVEMQIASSVSVIQNMPSLLCNIPEEFSPFVSRVYKFKCRDNKTSDLSIEFLGKNYIRELPETLLAAVSELLDYGCPELTFYNRLIFRGHKYFSENYGRAQKRNSYTVKYNSPMSKGKKFGYVQYFAKQKIVHNSDPVKCFAFIESFAEECSILKDLTSCNIIGVEVPHINSVRRSAVLEVVPIENLISVCVNVVMEGKLFVCEAPNMKEIDL